MKASVYRIMAVCLKEFTQLGRDRLTFGMVVMIPLIQLVLFGYSINTEVRNVEIAVSDHADSAFSRQLIMDLQATQVVTIGPRVATPEQLLQMVRRGEVSAGLFIPVDAERRYYARDGEPIGQLIIDGSDTILASALKSVAAMPFYPSRSPDVQPDRGQSLAATVLYNPEERAALFTVPGLLGIILTMTMVMFTSIAIVRERERGNMELLVATPVETTELMVGKLIPYVLIGFVQAGIILWIGHLLFQVPVAGSWPLLVFACAVFILANLGLGLLLSTLARSQLAAMQMFIFIFIPSVLLSGFMFPYQAMPQLAQWLAETLPATHFMRIVRGIILRDVPIDALTTELLYLGGFFVITMVFAIARFHQRLD